ncbi:MAG: dTMP kinase [Deltaproteobacteria bacterium RIFCSPHIGHO2_12_FULL_43_9]|nr:MAG: dTMP kinase [Deltaproteobacteria bacterium RIFCSPHIGHO2_12_FULL_43_9]
MKGLFITLEGVEGCGKSTQIRLLSRFLTEKGIAHVVTREPGGTEIGDKVRKILLDVSNLRMEPLTELLLYAASRAQHVLEVIRPAILGGKIVLCDRFFDSTLAYQGHARGIDPELVKRSIEIATDGLKPDLTFLLDIPAEVGIERATKKGVDRLEGEDLVFHKRVRQGFLGLAKNEPHRILVVDATCGVDELQTKLRHILEEKLRQWR